MTERGILGVVVATALAALAAAGCGAGRTHGVAGARVSLGPRCTVDLQRPVGSACASLAAVVVGEQVDARCRPQWLHVLLPLRPNGVTGWVRASHVQLVRVRTRIVVDPSERRVRFYKQGRLVFSSTAAIGSSATPTPLGRYYVNQRLIPRDPGGPFGPGAVGISAFSPVLTGWAQGGPIAIHGTNEPWSIGRAVSNGCIRLPNATLRKLFAQTPSGTPVLIRRLSGANDVTVP
jgi:hypothetical protein